MYKRAAIKTLWWPVTVSVPVEGGDTAKHGFDVYYAVLKQSDIDAVYAKGGTDVDLLKRVVLDWRDYADENGNAIAFSADALAEAIDTPYERGALVAAFLQLSNGREAARKN